MNKYPSMLLAFCTASVVTAAPERPNIIHIMVDDLGWRDLSSYGSETFETPHIDRLAERGLRVNNPWEDESLILGKDSRVVLRYYPEGTESGNTLRLEVDTNAATHVMAGIGQPPLYGKAKSIGSYYERRTVQELHLPLGKRAKAGDAVTVSIDMGHPGRITIVSIQLMD